MKPLKVLSLFDGISCGMIALERAGISIDTYQAWEIEPSAIKISQAHYPNIIQNGDVLKTDFTSFQDYDLLMGGSPCFAEGTMIKTIEGFKEIQDIKVGDMVLTHTGTYKKVYDTMNRTANNYCIVTGENMEKIVCTPNHPFYTKTMNRKYEKSKYKRKLSEECSWTPVEHFKKIKNTRNEIQTHTYLCSVTDTIEQYPTYNGTEMKVNQFVTQIKNELDLQDENLWYIIGRYLGDGWLKYKYKKNKKLLSGVVICCGKDEEKELEEKVKATNLHYYKNEERTTFRFTIINLELATYLLQFGQGAKNKHLIKDVYFLPSNLMKHFLNGYLDADGYYTTNTRTYVSVSKQLAYGIKYLINKHYNKPCGLHIENARTHTIENRKVQGSNTYLGISPIEDKKQKHYFVEDNYIFTPYKNVEYINEPIKVYNFSVEEDESYTANGIVVHNCTNWSCAKNHTAKEKKELYINEGMGWELFKQYKRCLDEAQPTYFLYENNYRISQNIIDNISLELGVQPILIDSALVSAQRRKRLYWTNIPNVTQPEDLGILLRDIYQPDPSLVKTDIRILHTAIETPNYVKYDLLQKGNWSQQDRLYYLDGKAPTIPKSRTKTKCNILLDKSDLSTYKQISVLEAERCQTLPDNYTNVEGLTETQRFEAIGNGWTVNVITHILNNLKDVIK